MYMCVSIRMCIGDTATSQQQQQLLPTRGLYRGFPPFTLFREVSGCMTRCLARTPSQYPCQNTHSLACLHAKSRNPKRRTSGVMV